MIHLLLRLMLTLLTLDPQTNNIVANNQLLGFLSTTLFTFLWMDHLQISLELFILIAQHFEHVLLFVQFPSQLLYFYHPLRVHRFTVAPLWHIFASFWRMALNRFYFNGNYRIWWWRFWYVRSNFLLLYFADFLLYLDQLWTELFSCEVAPPNWLYFNGCPVEYYHLFFVFLLLVLLWLSCFPRFWFVTIYSLPQRVGIFFHLLRWWSFYFITTLSHPALAFTFLQISNRFHPLVKTGLTQLLSLGLLDSLNISINPNLPRSAHQLPARHLPLHLKRLQTSLLGYQWWFRFTSHLLPSFLRMQKWPRRFPSITIATHFIPRFRFGFGSLVRLRPRKILIPWFRFRCHFWIRLTFKFRCPCVVPHLQIL